MVAAFGGLAFTCPAYAMDLTGAWATDTAACGKVFVTKGNKPSLRQDSEMYGSGFIMEGRRIRGRTASCTATKTSEEKGVVHMIASCATDIMYSNVQFSVKVLGENKISRIFPGIEGSGSEIRRLKRDEDRRRLIVHHRIS
jgi:hypothetical protein